LRGDFEAVGRLAWYGEGAVSLQTAHSSVDNGRELKATGMSEDGDVLDSVGKVSRHTAPPISIIKSQSSMVKTVASRDPLAVPDTKMLTSPQQGERCRRGANPGGEAEIVPPTVKPTDRAPRPQHPPLPLDLYTYPVLWIRRIRDDTGDPQANLGAIDLLGNRERLVEAHTPQPPRHLIHCIAILGHQVHPITEDRSTARMVIGVCNFSIPV